LRVSVHPRAFQAGDKANRREHGERKVKKGGNRAVGLTIMKKGRFRLQLRLRDQL
jgi:hypothetical protein